MTHKQISTNVTPRTKRLALGAVSVVAAGALLGLGVQGASAAPLDTASGHSASSSAHTTTDDSDSDMIDHAMPATLKKDIRTDIQQGVDNGERAQKIATTLTENPDIFATFPANLQADLTVLKDAAPVDRTAQAELVQTNAVNGVYGEQVQMVAEKIQQKVAAHAGAQAGAGAHAGILN